MNERIELGWRVRDRITGYTGIVQARTEWLHGCTRLNVQSQELREGKPVESLHIDEPQCEILDRSTAFVETHTEPRRVIGGPRNDERHKPE